MLNQLIVRAFLLIRKEDIKFKNMKETRKSIILLHLFVILWVGFITIIWLVTWPLHRKKWKTYVMLPL